MFEFFKPRERKESCILPNTAHKVLAAPDVSNDFFGSLIDWIGEPLYKQMSRLQRKESEAKPPKFAVALKDMIYI